MSGSRRGLTMIEILLAVVILVFVLGSAYVVLYTTIEARAHIDSALAADRIGTRILAVVQADLRATCIYRSKETTFAATEAQGSVPQTSEIHFLTTSRSILPEGERSSPVNEVGYVLEPNPERPGYSRLFRREDFFVDDKPTEGGKRIILHDVVRQFRMTFHGEKPEETAGEWKVGEKKGFPRRVDILLVLAMADEGAPAPGEDLPLYRFKSSVEILSREAEEEKKEEGEDDTGDTSGPEVLGPEDVENPK